LNLVLSHNIVVFSDWITISARKARLHPRHKILSKTVSLIKRALFNLHIASALSFQLRRTALPSAFMADFSSKRHKAGSALDEVSAKGAFVRTDATFRDMVEASADAKYPAASGRYHLYVAYACPWAHRCLMARSLKGLEGVISVSAVHPTWQRTRPNDPEDQHCGWVSINSSVFLLLVFFCYLFRRNIVLRMRRVLLTIYLAVRPSTGVALSQRSAAVAV
jgi:hypothetical protein